MTTSVGKELGYPVGKQLGWPSSRPLIYGIARNVEVTSLQTTNGFGIAGSAVSGVSVIVAFYLNAVPASTQTLTRRISGATGWSVRLVTNGIQCLASNNTITATAPATTLTASHVGKIHLVALSCDLSAVYQYWDKTVVGVSTAMTGYTPTAASQPTAYGSSAGGGNPSPSATILGVVGRNSHTSLADFSTICDATKTAGRLALGGITMEHQWLCPQGGAMPSTLPNDISASASDDLTFTVGSAANLNVTLLADAWGF